jgi:hypothetical protein
MEFHGKFNGIPWNFPWNSIEFYESEVDGIPWNPMENSMEFHGIRQLTEFDVIRF